MKKLGQILVFLAYVAGARAQYLTGLIDRSSIQPEKKEKKDPSPVQNLISTKQLEDTKKKVIWSHSSTAYVSFDGPEWSDQTYSLKQDTNVKWSVHTIETHLEHNSTFNPNGKTSDKSVLGLKYIRTLSPHWGALYGYGVTYSPFEAVWVTETHDVGPRAIYMITPKTYLLIEPTGRFKKTVDNKGNREYSPNARIYAEIGHNLTDWALFTFSAQYVRRLTSPYDYDAYTGFDLQIYLGSYFWMELNHMFTYTTLNRRLGKNPFYYQSYMSLTAHY